MGRRAEHFRHLRLRRAQCATQGDIPASSGTAAVSAEAAEAPTRGSTATARRTGQAARRTRRTLWPHGTGGTATPDGARSCQVLRGSTRRASDGKTGAETVGRDPEDFEGGPRGSREGHRGREAHSREDHMQAIAKRLRGLKPRGLLLWLAKPPYRHDPPKQQRHEADEQQQTGAYRAY